MPNMYEYCLFTEPNRAWWFRIWLQTLAMSLLCVSMWTRCRVPGVRLFTIERCQQVINGTSLQRHIVMIMLRPVYPWWSLTSNAKTQLLAVNCECDFFVYSAQPTTWRIASDSDRRRHSSGVLEGAHGAQHGGYTVHHPVRLPASLDGRTLANTAEGGWVVTWITCSDHPYCDHMLR